MAKKATPKVAAPKAAEFRFEDLVESNSLKTVIDIGREQANYRVYSTGCLMLDCAIGEADPIKGNMGVPQRTIMEVFGRNQSNKTALFEQLTKNILLDNPENVVFWFYSEESDMDRWESIGVTKEMQKRVFSLGCFEGEQNFIDTAEKQLDRIKKAVQDPRVKLVVIDSIKAMCSARMVYDENGKEKSLADGYRVAMRASLMTEFIREFKIHNKRAILGMTNQEMDVLKLTPQDMHSNPQLTFQTPGGRTMEFECQLRIRSVTTPLETAEHELTKKKLVYGWDNSFKVIKNKFCKSSTGRVAVGQFLFEPPGFNRVGAALTLGGYLTTKGLISPELGVVKGGGGYWTLVGQQVRGEDSAIELLAENEGLVESLESQVYLHADKLFKFIADRPKDKKDEPSIEDII